MAAAREDTSHHRHQHRQLTMVLREHGVMMGRIETHPLPLPKGGEFNDHQNYGSVNWVEKVSCKEVITYNRGAGKRVVLVDCGVKANIIRCLVRRGLEVIRVPWDHDFNQLDFDGLFLANGPGDPEQCEVTVGHIRQFLKRIGKRRRLFSCGWVFYPSLHGHLSWQPTVGSCCGGTDLQTEIRSSLTQPARTASG